MKVAYEVVNEDEGAEELRSRQASAFVGREGKFSSHVRATALCEHVDAGPERSHRIWTQDPRGASARHTCERSQVSRKTRTLLFLASADSGEGAACS